MSDGTKIYKSKSTNNGRSIENVKDKLRIPQSLNHLPQKMIEINSVKKKISAKNSLKSSEISGLLSSSTPNLFEIISPRNEKWIIVQEALTNCLFGKTIKNITDVLGCVRFLAEQSVGNEMMEYYEMQILKNTLHKMQKKLITISDIENCWVLFYRKSLPNVNLIFSSLKTQQELIENISLFEFKRRVAKVEDLKEKLLKKKEEITFCLGNIINMFLILLPIRRKDNQYSEIDATFEEAAAVLVSPLIGYKGVYIDGLLTIHARQVNIATDLTNSVSKGLMNKNRKSLEGVFVESKSLLDITGDF